MSDTADSFIGKWRRRWPEWSVAEAFVPAPQRRPAMAWFTLLQELAEAAWGGADPTPGLAKLAWWHEELEGWAKGGRRHPLGEVLQRLEAPWAPLARELSGLPDTRGRAPGEALEALEALSAAVSGCEAALFAEERAAPGQASAAAAVRAALLGERALLTGAGDDAGWLLERWPRPSSGPVPRRLYSRLLRARLERLAAGRPAAPMPGWQVLGASWRASRGS